MLSNDLTPVRYKAPAFLCAITGLAAVVSGKTGLGNAVGVNHITDKCRRGPFGDFQLVGAERVQGEYIAMGFIAHRWAGATETSAAKIGATLSAACGKVFAIHSTGTGGMVTKLQAAAKASAQGIETLIINGQKADSFAQLLAGKACGTLFHKQQERLSAKKHWLLHSLKTRGELQLDSGAVQALLHKGASLLPKGISSISGDFDKGDAIWLVSNTGDKLAKGVCQYSAPELNKIKGIHSAQIEAVLGYCPSEVAVHRDDLVLMEQQ